MTKKEARHRERRRREPPRGSRRGLRGFSERQVAGLWDNGGKGRRQARLGILERRVWGWKYVTYVFDCDWPECGDFLVVGINRLTLCTMLVALVDCVDDIARSRMSSTMLIQRYCPRESCKCAWLLWTTKTIVCWWGSRKCWKFNRWVFDKVTICTLIKSGKD